MRRTTVLACLLLVATVLPGAAAGRDKVKLGMQPYISHAGFFIALAKGYFAQQGLDVEPKVSRAAGSEMLTALLSGEYDVIGGGLGVSTYNAVLRGGDIKIIADKGGNKGDQSYTWIVVRKALVDAGQVKSMADLKGKRLGSPGPGNANWIELMMMLEKAGVRPSEVEIVKLNAPDRVSSLLAGTIDAAVVAEPFVTKAVDSGKVVALAPTGSLGNFLEAVVITTAKQIGERRDVIRRFLAGYVRGVRDYVGNPREAGNVAAIAKYTGLPPELIAKTHPFYMEASGRVDTATVQREMEWLVGQHLLDRTVPVEKFVDNSLLPQ